MSIDLSCFDGALTAVYRYEVFRKMVDLLTKELSKASLDCIMLSEEGTCLEQVWRTNKQQEGYNDLASDMPEYGSAKTVDGLTYEGMCDCCKRKQDIIDERKRCRKEWGAAKRMASLEGKKIIKEFSEEGYDPFQDEFFNKLGVK